MLDSNKTGLYLFKSKDWGLNDFEVLDKFKEHGFDIVCLYCIDPPEQLKKCIAYARQIGLCVDTLHAPFKFAEEIWFENTEDYFNSIKDYLIVCAEMNIKYFVMHSSNKECLPFTDIGLKRFKELVKMAKKLNVIILLENLRMVDHMIFVLEQIKSQNLQVCLDFGHANIWSYPSKYLLKKYKTHIKALHICDNFGLSSGDIHLIPFKGNIDWNENMSLLSKYYNGPLILEIDNFKTQEYRYNDIDKYLNDAKCAVEKLKAMYNKFLKSNKK